MVRRIFADYLAGKGIKAIAEALTADGIPSAYADDPARNRHSCGIAWSWGAVATILGNPRYTGRQVWNRQCKDEVLLDVQTSRLGSPPSSGGTSPATGSGRSRSCTSR